MIVTIAAMIVGVALLPMAIRSARELGLFRAAKKVARWLLVTLGVILSISLLVALIYFGTDYAAEHGGLTATLREVPPMAYFAAIAALAAALRRKTKAVPPAPGHKVPPATPVDTDDDLYDCFVEECGAAGQLVQMEREVFKAWLNREREQNAAPSAFRIVKVAGRVRVECTTQPGTAPSPQP